MRKWEVLLGVGILVSLLVLGGTSWAANSHKVETLDYQPWYEPAGLAIDVGDTVTWNNPSVHTVTDIKLLTTGQPDFHKVLLPGDSFSFTFTSAGEWDYLCALHPWMRGKIIARPGRVSPVKKGEIWVAAQFQNGIQIIDPDTDKVVDFIHVGNNPHNIWFTPDGKYAYVTGWHEDDLYKIDVKMRSVVKKIENVGPAPAHVYVSPQGTVYATIMGDKYIIIIDGKTDTVVGKIETGQGPHGFWPTPNWKYFVVAESHAANAAIVDIAAKKTVGFIDTGVVPLGASVTPDGKKAYIGNGISGTISVLDLTTMKKIKDLKVGGLPVQTPVNPKYKYAVVPNKHLGVAHIVDTIRDVVIRDVPTAKGAHGADFSPDGRYAYVSNTFSDTTTKIDMETFKTTDIAMTGGPNTSGGQGVTVYGGCHGPSDC
ncbi:MAG: hypothetical protein HY284_04535 [Nitrospirae bacterium]|nr:hypothetical protein [Nitrospirota bacterium]